MANSKDPRGPGGWNTGKERIWKLKLDRQSECYRLLLGFSCEKTGKCETSEGNVNRSCETERMNLLEKVWICGPFKLK